MSKRSDFVCLTKFLSLGPFNGKTRSTVKYENMGLFFTLCTPEPLLIRVLLQRCNIRVQKSRSLRVPFNACIWIKSRGRMSRSLTAFSKCFMVIGAFTCYPQAPLILQSSCMYTCVCVYVTHMVQQISSYLARMIYIWNSRSKVKFMICRHPMVYT